MNTYEVRYNSLTYGPRALYGAYFSRADALKALSQFQYDVSNSGLSQMDKAFLLKSGHIE
jgi:hypothetical protein